MNGVNEKVWYCAPLPVSPCLTFTTITHAPLACPQLVRLFWQGESADDWNVIR